MFKEIVLAAIEEICGKEIRSEYRNFMSWMFNDHKIFIHRHDGLKPSHEIEICLEDSIIFVVHETDLLDPNWSPATLAKQISDTLAGPPSRLDPFHAPDPPYWT